MTTRTLRGIRNCCGQQSKDKGRGRLRDLKQQKPGGCPEDVCVSHASRNAFPDEGIQRFFAELKTAKTRRMPGRRFWEPCEQKRLPRTRASEGFLRNLK